MVAPGPVPPPDPWHRRYWGYYNRPYGGCGCLYTVLVVLLLWWLLSLLIPSLAIWDTAAMWLPVALG